MLTELAWALSKQGDHSAALARLASIRGYAPTGPTDLQHFEKTLLLEEARILRCDGQLERASAAFAGALARTEALGQLNDPPAGARLDLAVRLSEQAEVFRWRGMGDEADAVARRAAGLAGWPGSGVQRPKRHFEAGLPELPWLDPPFGAEWVAELVASLEAAAGSLTAEYDRVLAAKAGGGFLRQTECLHDPARGSWSYLAVKGDRLGCATASAPEACAWLAGLTGLAAASVRRLGYSTIEPSAWIR